MSERGKQARALFEEGYNCAQAVAGAFADSLGLPLETIARMVSAYGGGIGRMRETCGAVSGMAFIIGMRYGYSSPTATSEKKEVYALTQRLIGKFKEENGSLICRELLGLPAEAPTDAVPEKRTAAYYRKRPCAELVEQAADILAEYEEERLSGAE